jgi:hypothetical protein
LTRLRGGFSSLTHSIFYARKKRSARFTRISTAINTADLAVHYARAGWLKWLARGVYLRPEQGLSLYPSLLLLERRIEGLHVGGRDIIRRLYRPRYPSPP